MFNLLLFYILLLHFYKLLCFMVRIKIPFPALVVEFETFSDLFGFAAFPFCLLYTCNHDLPSVCDVCNLPTLSCHTCNVRSHEACTHVGIVFWLASLSAVAFPAVALCIRAHSDLFAWSFYVGWHQTPTLLFYPGLGTAGECTR